MAALVLAICCVWAYVFVAFVIEQIQLKRESDRWRVQFEADLAERQAQKPRMLPRAVAPVVNAPFTAGRRIREAVLRVVVWLIVVVLPLTIIWQVIR